MRADQIDLRTAARDAIADVEQEARDDRIDVRSEARDASIDVRSDARADQIDLRTAARDDIADARQAARDDSADARQKARDDAIDLRTAARDDIADAEVSVGDDRQDARIDASDESADARLKAGDEIADAQIESQDSGDAIFADALLTAGVALEQHRVPDAATCGSNGGSSTVILRVSVQLRVSISTRYMRRFPVLFGCLWVWVRIRSYSTNPQNDLLAFRAGQQAARGTSRAFSPNQTQRENAADFSHHFGAGFTSGGQAQPESQGGSDRPMIIQLHLNDRVVQEMFLRGAELIGQDRLLFNPLRGG